MAIQRHQRLQPDRDRLLREPRPARSDRRDRRPVTRTRPGQERPEVIHPDLVPCKAIRAEELPPQRRAPAHRTSPCSANDQSHARTPGTPQPELRRGGCRQAQSTCAHRQATQPSAPSQPKSSYPSGSFDRQGGGRNHAAPAGRTRRPSGAPPTTGGILVPGRYRVITDNSYARGLQTGRFVSSPPLRTDPSVSQKSSRM
jgi:hypothetical protein